MNKCIGFDYLSNVTYSVVLNS